MGDATGIEWTDATWNPIRGCSRISKGCMNCYAERVANRFSGTGAPYEGLVSSHGRWNGTIRVISDHLADPLRWKRPRKIFVNSMSDLFHENLANEQIAAVFGVMAAAPQHTFQILTKRATRMREWFGWVDGGPHTPHPRELVEDAALKALNGIVETIPARRDARWPLPNVWLGVSVEDQDAADERIPDLLATPAPVRFLSCEPLIGSVDLTGYVERLDWVIIGAESGPGARPCEAKWIRQIVSACRSAGARVFVKQANEEIEIVQTERGSYPHAAITAGDGSQRKGKLIKLPYLDGRQLAEFPPTTGK